ncbi:MAG: OmpA family protein [Nitrospirota bacterium]
MKRRVRTGVTIAAVLMAGGCVSETSFRDVMQQLQQALGKNEQLQGQVNGLNAQLVQLGQEKAALQAELTTRQARLEELTGQLDAQAEQIKSLSGKPAVTTRIVTKFKEPDMGWADGLTKELKKEFAEEARRGEVTVKPEARRLVIHLSEPALFEPDDFRVSLEGETLLARLGKILARIKQQQIIVGGHLDTTPIAQAMAADFPTAWDFTGARAVEVARYLQEESGVSGSLLSAAAYGAARPISTNATEAGRALNRRIEVVLSP